jgi:phage virion morphogenesis protein
MSSVTISFNTKPLSDRLDEIADRFDHVEAIMDDIAEYMVRSVRNRILRSKRDPKGERWKSLSKVTKELKGHERILFDTGELSRSIEVTSADGDGFTVSATADHASYMQLGVARTGGMIKGKEIPARPFMGFSDANRRRIGRMLRDYIQDGTTNFYGEVE